MTSAYSINLNFNNTIPVKTDFTFKQGDKGITLNLATTGLDTTGTTAKIVFKRSNGTSVEADLVGAGPTYSYTILGNEFEIPGVVVADLKLYNGDTQRVSTASFIFLVTGDTMDGVGGGTGGYSDQLEQLSQEFADTLEQYEEAFADVGAVHPAGNYDPTTEYSPLDLVYYSTDNSTYLCVEGCTGETPSPSSQYWQLVVDGSSVATPDLDDLGDVDMTGVQNGQVPTYNSTTQKYEPGNGGGGGSVDYEDLENKPSINGIELSGDKSTEDLEIEVTALKGVNITSPQDGDLLAYDASNSEWKNDSYLRKTVDEIYAEIGSKNQLLYPYLGQITSGGLTFTDDGEGRITVSAPSYPYTVTASYAEYLIHSRITEPYFAVPNGNYIMSGCPSGGSAATYQIYMYGYQKSSTASKSYDPDTGNGSLLELDGDYYSNTETRLSVSILLYQGTTLTGPLVFKPMLRDASITDDTWQPYGQSKFTNKTDLTSIIATGFTNTTGAQIPNGAYFYLNGVFCRAIADIATNATFTKNTNYKETTVGDEIGIIERARSAAGDTTYGAKVSRLYSAYNALSDERKRNAYITANELKFYKTEENVFTNVNGDSGQLNNWSLNLNAGTVYLAKITSSGTTISNYSSSTSGMTFILWA